jgi:hypothetical protein
MSDEAKPAKPLVSRRTALTAAGAIGVTVAAASVTHMAAAAESPSTSSNKSVQGPVVIRIRDLTSGQLDVFTGSGYVQVQDKDLANRLLRAAARA